MSPTSEIRPGRHCVFNLHVHLIFVTKYRRNILTQTIFNSLKKFAQKVCCDFETTIKKMNGKGDHVHFLLEYPPKVQLSKLVNSLKGVTSRKLKECHPEMVRNCWKGALWSPSYFAGSCEETPLSIIQEYIKNQKLPESERFISST